MRRLFYSLGLVAVVALTGCSSDDSLSSEGNSNMLNSDVEIRLASNSQRTRASIESDDAGNFETENIGVFCLAKGELELDYENSHMPISWIPGVDESGFNYSVWMNNVPANAVKTENAEGNVYTGINWEGKYYYPIGNGHYYGFYGYHPYVSDDNITYTEDCITASVILDGKTDLIWGRTNCDEPWAYSARYFRVAGNKDKLPNIEFEHKLMRITFSVKAGELADEEGGGIDTEALGMGIYSISILQVPTNATMVIADRNNPENEGKVVFDWNDSLEDFTLLDTYDSPLGTYSDLTVTEEAKHIGQGVLVPVPDVDTYYGDGRYEIYLVLQDADGQPIYPGTKVPLNLAPGKKFEEGYSYNVCLSVYANREIKLNAILKPWIEDDETIVGPDAN